MSIDSDYALGLLSYEDYMKAKGLPVEQLQSPIEEKVEEGGSTSLPAQLYRGTIAATRDSLLSGIVDFGAGVSRMVTRGYTAKAANLAEKMAETPEEQEIADKLRLVDQEIEKKYTDFSRKTKQTTRDFYESLTPAPLREAAVEVKPEWAGLSDEELEFKMNLEMWKTRPLEQGLSSVSSAAGSMLPSLAAVYLTRNPSAFFWTSAGLQSSSVYEDIFQKRAEGKSAPLQDVFGDATPEVIAGLAGAFTAISEKFLIGKKLAGVLLPEVKKTITQKLMGAAATGAKEGFQEVLEQLQQNFTEKLGYNDGQLLYAGLLDSFVGGFGSGAGLGMISQKVEAAQDSEREVKIVNWSSKLKDELALMKKQDGTPLYDATTINTIVEPLEKLARRVKIKDKQMDELFEFVIGREPAGDPQGDVQSRKPTIC